MLFADIQDSMQLAERLGAEAWHSLLDRFFHLSHEGVHRFEGTVNQYTGDGIMALFGAPLGARGSRPARLPRGPGVCATRLRAFAAELGARARPDASRAHGTQFGRGGRRPHRRRSAHGLHRAGAHGRPRAAGRAARRSQHGLRRPGDRGAGGGLLRAARARRPHAERRQRARARLRARATAARAQARIDVVLARSRHAPGRPRRRARRARARARRGRSPATGRSSACVGEPGVGKTRLCLELLRRCRGARRRSSPRPTVRRTPPASPCCRSSSCCARSFGVARRRAPAEPAGARSGARSRATQHAASATRCRWSSICWTSPIPSSPRRCSDEQRRRAARRRSCAAWCRRRAPSVPLVLFIDDLHCIDRDGDALLGEIVDALGWTRTLLLVNFRPQLPVGVDAGALLSRAAAGGAGRRRRPTSCCAAWSAIDGPPPTLRQLIRERTGGNPFFAEEVVQSLSTAACSCASRVDEHAAHAGAPTRTLRLARPIADLSIPADRAGAAGGTPRPPAAARQAGAAGRGRDRPALSRPPLCATSLAHAPAARRGHAVPRRSTPRSRRSRAPTSSVATRRRRRRLYVQASADAGGRLRLAARRVARPPARRRRARPAGATRRPTRPVRGAAGASLRRRQLDVRSDALAAARRAARHQHRARPPPTAVTAGWDQSVSQGRCAMATSQLLPRARGPEAARPRAEGRLDATGRPERASRFGARA